MVKVSICIGSACHLRGAHAVLAAFNSLIEKYNAQAMVDIEGNFCQGRCTEGVVIKINEDIIANVTKENVHAIFLDKVLGR